MINSEHEKILSKIYELYIKSGGKPFLEPGNWELNEFGKKSSEGIEIQFDYGVPMRMLTPDGHYGILGGCLCGNNNRFWEFFTQEFEVIVIMPKRDDCKTSELSYMTSYSGPLVRITQKYR